MVHSHTVHLPLGALPSACVWYMHRYERGTRILNVLRKVFDKAEVKMPKTQCTVHDVSERERLGPGDWACHQPMTDFPQCPQPGEQRRATDTWCTPLPHRAPSPRRTADRDCAPRVAQARRTSPGATTSTR